MKKRLFMLITVIILLGLTSLTVQWLAPQKILYGFMKNAQGSPGFTFYEADQDNPLALSKLADFSHKDMPGRDISLYQAKNGRLYGAVTTYDLANNIEIALYEGEGVNHLTRLTMNLGITALAQAKGRQVQKVWAPDFFEDDKGQVYLFTTANDRGTTRDKAGQVIPAHSLYRVKLDLEHHRVIETREMVLPLKKNYIDTHVFTKDGDYYLLVKDEKEKTIDLYQSDDLEQWSLVEENILSLANQSPLDYTEGPFTIKMKDAYYLFYDKYEDSKGYRRHQYVTKTKDFRQFSRPKIVTDSQQHVLRHGSAIIYRPMYYRRIRLILHSLMIMIGMWVLAELLYESISSH